MHERDIQAYDSEEQRRKEANEQSDNSSDSSTGSEREDADEYAKMTINDAPGNPEHFDAFLSYTSVDKQFALEVMEVLERQNGIKLCVPDRDLLAGGAHYTIIARLIKERCKKMIIVLSPEYIRSVDCDFHVKYQQALDPGARKKKLIPIMYRQCAVPDILTIIACLDYPEYGVFDFFWNRLVGALRPTPTHTHPVPSRNQRLNPPLSEWRQTAPVSSRAVQVVPPVTRPPSIHTAPCGSTGVVPSASEVRSPVQTESDNAATGNITTDNAVRANCATGNTSSGNTITGNSATGNTASENATSDNTRKSNGKRANTRTEVAPENNFSGAIRRFTDLLRKKPLPSLKVDI